MFRLPFTWPISIWIFSSMHVVERLLYKRPCFFYAWLKVHSEPIFSTMLTDIHWNMANNSLYGGHCASNAAHQTKANTDFKRHKNRNNISCAAVSPCIKWVFNLQEGLHVVPVNHSRICKWCHNHQELPDLKRRRTHVHSNQKAANTVFHGHHSSFLGCKPQKMFGLISLALHRCSPFCGSKSPTCMFIASIIHR